MRTIIAGSRDITDPTIVARAVKASGFEVSTVICGGAEGVDTLGEAWAKGLGLPVEYFLAKWQTHGKKAGPMRNQLMAQSAEALVAIPRQGSKGTWDMVRRAKLEGLKVYVFYVPSRR